MRGASTDTSSGPAGDPEKPREIWVFRVFSILSCAVLFAMMVFTFSDVMGRYLFLSPLPGGYEVVSLMMPAIIFLALPLSVLRDSHVTVDLLDRYVPDRIARVRALVVYLICAATMLLLAWRLGVKSQDQYRYQDVSDELVLALWPLGAFMAILCALTALTFLALFVRQIVRIRRTGRAGND